MVFLGEASIRRLDHLVLGLGVDLEDLVRVGVRRRAHAPAASSERSGGLTNSGRAWTMARASSGSIGGSSSRWKRYRTMLRAAAAIGSARIAPSSPAIAPPTTSATITALG